MDSFLAHFAHPHAPDFALLTHQPPVILIHLAFAVAAFAIGAVQITGARFMGLGGAPVHRILGWTWVIMMAVVAISSFFIHLINPAGFSLIHILSVVTLVLLPVGIYGARKHNVKLHSRTMSRLFLFALVIAGIFTLFPGRLMYNLFFG